MKVAKKAGQSSFVGWTFRTDSKEFKVTLFSSTYLSPIQLKVGQYFSDKISQSYRANGHLSNKKHDQSPSVAVLTHPKSLFAWEFGESKKSAFFLCSLWKESTNAAEGKLRLVCFKISESVIWRHLSSEYFSLHACCFSCTPMWWNRPQNLCARWISKFHFPFVSVSTTDNFQIQDWD